MARITQPRRILFYEDGSGREPFIEWVSGLRDAKTRRRIQNRLLRVEQGNLGDHVSVGDGVSELRLFFGPGYRVYYGEQAQDIVVLLCGGDKSSQPRDIEWAKSYWKEYQTR